MAATATEQIQHPRIRPRFQVEISHSVEEIEAVIQSHLAQDTAPCLGRVQHGHGTITLPIEEQHYWSPQLSLSIEETDEGSLVRGVYGPRPSVWTMFVFFYALIGFAAMMVAIIGFSYYSLGKTEGKILWLLPVLVLGFLTLYLVSYFGQKLGREQISTLHHFIGDCIGDMV